MKKFFLLVILCLPLTSLWAQLPPPSTNRVNVKLGWEYPYTNINSFIVFYGTLTNNVYTSSMFFANTKVGVTNGLTSHSALIVNLTPNIKYYFAVGAVDSLNLISPLSNEVVFTPTNAVTALTNVVTLSIKLESFPTVTGPRTLLMNMVLMKLTNPPGNMFYSGTLGITNKTQ